VTRTAQREQTFCYPARLRRAGWLRHARREPPVVLRPQHLARPQHDRPTGWPRTWSCLGW